MTGSLYIPGKTWLHRTPAWLKLLLLALTGWALTCVHDAASLLAALCLTVVLVCQTGVSASRLWGQVRPLFWFMLVLALYTAFVQDALMAAQMVLRLSALILLALVVSFSTPISQMMVVVEWLLLPLEKLGWVRASRVALAVGLTLRLIPELIVQWHDIREAQAARGISCTSFTLLVPMLVRTIRRAEEIAEAIDARGVY